MQDAHRAQMWDTCLLEALNDPEIRPKFHHNAEKYELLKSQARSRACVSATAHRTHLHTQRVGGIHIGIAIKRSLKNHVSRVACGSAAVGVGGVMKNKGRFVPLPVTIDTCVHISFILKCTRLGIQPHPPGAYTHHTQILHF